MTHAMFINTPSHILPHWMKHFSFAGCASLLLLASSHAQLIEPAAPVKSTSPASALAPRLVSLAASLDHPSLQVREAALAEILSDSSITLTMIESIMESGKLMLPDAPPTPLSPEQQKRLETIGMARFSQLPRAAMGVQFAPFDSRSNGVEITAPIDRFDAKRVLEPGDIIQKIGVLFITRQDQLRTAIISHEPGDEVELQILRAGEQLTVTLFLGHRAALEEQNRALRGGQNNRNWAGVDTIDTLTLQAAWKLRTDRVLAAKRAAENAAPIDSGLSEAQWATLHDALDFGSEPQMGRVNGAQIRFNDAPNLRLAGNQQVIINNRGVPVFAPANRADTDIQPAGGVLPGGSARTHFTPVPAIFVAGTSAQEQLSQSGDLQTRLAQIEVELRQVQQRLLDPGNNAQMNLKLRELQRALLQDKSAIQAQLKRNNAGAFVVP